MSGALAKSFIHLPSYNKLCRLCWLIVVALNTCQIAYSSDNTTVSECPCNSTIIDPSIQNTTGKLCNCTQNTANCTTGYRFSNGTCVKCSCNPTTTRCNCSAVQKAQDKQSCLQEQFLANISHGEECQSCNCSVHTSLNNNCDNRTGQCACKEFVIGQNCTVCAANYTANYSHSGDLLNCYQQVKCPQGFRRTAKNECVRESTTSLLLSTKEPSLVITSRSEITTVRDDTSVIIVSSTTSSISVPTVMPSSSLPAGQKRSTKVLPSISSEKSPSNTILQSTKKSPSIPTHSSTPTPILPKSTTIISPSTTKSPTPSSTGLPMPTNTPTTSTNTPEPTTDDSPTTDEPTTDERTMTTEAGTPGPSSEKPTTSTHHNHTSEKMPAKDRSSDVLLIVLVCLGVVVILGIAIAVGCWCLRSQRKPSTPFWTVELSNARNEELDFALLDPVTDEPHKKVNDTSEADTSITEHSRYYAYI